MTVTRRTRLWDVAPVAAACGLLGAAHGRWPLAAPVIALLFAWPLLGRRFTYGRWRLIGSGLAGGLVGLTLAWIAPTPPGPVPSIVLGPLTGFLATSAAFLILAERRLYAWSYAGLIVALCQHGTELPVAAAGVAVFALALLACGLRAGGVGRSGRVGILAFSVFLLLAGPAAGGIGRLVLASEGAFMEAIARATGARNPLRNFGLEESLTLSRYKSVESSDRALLLVSGAAAPLLRTTVLEQFDGLTWTAARRTTPELRGGREGTSLRLTFVTDLGGVLPAPAGVNTVEGLPAWTAPGGVLRTRSADGKSATLWWSAGAPELEPVDRPMLTALPDGLREELAPLARGLIGDATGTRAIAERLTAHFREQHTYTLEVELTGRGSPLAVLIRERRPAYCTYFASALAALLRTQGIPARVVGGFAPPPANALTAERLVRERDAHAWVEVWIDEEQRFVAMDPTPWRSRDLIDGVDREASLLETWLEAAGLKLRRAWLAFTTDPLGALARLAAAWPTWVVGVLLAAYLLRRRISAVLPRRPRAAMQTADAELLAARRRFAQLLRQHAGLSAGDAETDAELLERVGAACSPELATRAATFVRSYQAARFGGEAAGEALRVHLDAFERAIKDNARPRG